MNNGSENSPSTPADVTDAGAVELTENELDAIAGGEVMNYDYKKITQITAKIGSVVSPRDPASGQSSG